MNINIRNLSMLGLVLILAFGAVGLVHADQPVCPGNSCSAPGQATAVPQSTPLVNNGGQPLPNQAVGIGVANQSMTQPAGVIVNNGGQPLPTQAVANGVASQPQNLPEVLDLSSAPVSELPAGQPLANNDGVGVTQGDGDGQTSNNGVGAGGNVTFRADCSELDGKTLPPRDPNDQVTPEDVAAALEWIGGWAKLTNTNGCIHKGNSLNWGPVTRDPGNCPLEQCSWFKHWQYANLINAGDMYIPGL